MQKHTSFGFNTPEESPGFLLWQTTIMWQRHIKAALKPFGISHAQFVILAVTLWFTEQQISPNQTLLAEKTKLDKMTISAALKQLRDKQLINRQEDDQDARAKTLALTQAGQALTQQLVKAIEQVDAAFFQTTDPAALTALLRQIAAISD